MELSVFLQQPSRFWRHKEVERKRWIIKESRTHQVLKLLSDGEVHKTTELEKPPKTRDWPSSQAEDRHSWFRRTMLKGYINKVSKHNQKPAKWQITEKGAKLYEELKLKEILKGGDKIQ